MTWKLKANKTKMYQLVKEYGAVATGLRKTEFKFYRRTYWLEYRDQITEHRMEACLSICCGCIYLKLNDLWDSAFDETVNIPMEEALSRGLLESV